MEAAVRRMALHRVGALVVVDGEARPVGIITDRDAALRCVGEGSDPATTRVAGVMTTPVRTVSETTPIEDALSLMASAATRRVVVVDGEGRLAGILAMDDVLELIVEEMRSIGRLLERQEPNLPTTARMREAA